MDRWQFARDLFDEHFRPLRDTGDEIERLTDADTYWALHDAELRAFFPEEYAFSHSRLRTDSEREGQARLARAHGGEPLRDFAVVRRAGRIAAMFCGEQKGEGMYRMWHSNVHPDFRRQGLYRSIVQGTISYTAALGFDTITSEHAPCNNPILIAKLRAGFRVFALDLDGMVGPSLVLRYFHNADHLAAYQLRCGMATLTSNMAANGVNAWPLFRDQVLSR